MVKMWWPSDILVYVYRNRHAWCNDSQCGSISSYYNTAVMVSMVTVRQLEYELSKPNISPSQHYNKFRWSEISMTVFIVLFITNSAPHAPFFNLKVRFPTALVMLDTDLQTYPTNPYHLITCTATPTLEARTDRLKCCPGRSVWDQ